MSELTVATLRQLLLAALPQDGTPIGNIRLRSQLSATLDEEVSEELYSSTRDGLVEEGIVAKGQGRGGSVRLLEATENAVLTLESQEIPEDAQRPKPKQTGLPLAKRQVGQPTKAKTRGAESEEKVVAYQHKDHRTNNPEVGLVTPDDDPDQPKTTWAYDPHIDPALQFDIGRSQIERLIDDALAASSNETEAATGEILAWLDHALAGGDEAAIREVVTNLRARISSERQKYPAYEALTELKRMSAPYLNWAGKAERTSFDVDTVSLHVHERIDPATILGRIRKRIKDGKKGATSPQLQDDMFRAWFDQPLSYREAIEFYKHDRGWANRLIAGDSLQVMNSLLQKESMAGQVQMIYIDPPYGIKYGSNFQPFVNKRDVKDRSDQDLTQEPEMIKAFRDTWELGIHSYLTYLRDRLLLAKELLHESGSVFVQIGDENVHLARNLLDEMFGAENLVAEIIAVKTSSATSEFLAGVADIVLFYARDKSKLKYRQLFTDKALGGEGTTQYTWVVSKETGERRRMTPVERAQPSDLQVGLQVFAADNLTSQRPPGDFPVSHHGKDFVPGKGYWKTHSKGFARLSVANRLEPIGNSLMYRRMLNDFGVSPINNIWRDVLMTGFSEDKVYVVQTSQKIVERCLLMATDPGDLVLDPTCGSGTTAIVAEKWGRRWITCDTSRVSVTLAKQRLMTASYDYYELKYPHEGLKAGFIYKTVPHVTLKSIANNQEIDTIYERDHSAIEDALATLNAKLRAAPPKERFKVTEGGRKAESLDFAKGAALQGWEVPFDYPEGWPAAARKAFDAFHEERQAMQQRMDASIAAHADQETLYDQPEASKTRLRITGPFTVEAVPFPSVASLEEAENTQTTEADTSIARSGESLRQHSYRDELMNSGIRGKKGQILKFASLETVPGLRYIHLTGTLVETGERLVVSFGPEYAALEQRQVEMAMREAGELFPRPKMIVFAAFTFDPEAAKDIDNTKGITALKAQMNTDLLTEDLKKKQRGNQSFWLMGQPDVELRRLKDGHYQVEVHGFDYFDTNKGDLVSGGKGKIAMWSLDTDYDERSLFPSQVFFPMAGKKDGWEKLKKNIKAELNESLLQQFHGTVSLPFEPGDNRKVAVKIVDDRGIESLKIIVID
ncbi:DNA methylase [Rhodanobacter sp. Root480]|uniref:site-specific DNA-methyltransferase n=1 Tax=Rhodanobacter sp. Root480 TaxID=1736542 RepID=UPI0006F61AB1|nr:site-specific DNA-methyltransferase [Rhodanobacter sp. Root480]KQX97766.1 DNA methylase [Rhodanobacter sp. Root480]